MLQEMDKGERSVGILILADVATVEIILLTPMRWEG